MLATTNSAFIWGMKGNPVKVEANLARGLPAWHLVGLGDKAIKESIDRIRAAISNSGYDYPRQDVTINLVPAGTPKHGSHFDLPMAVALLAAMGVVQGKTYQSFGMLGELSLSGQLQRVSGALLLVQSMKEAGIKDIIVPEGNGKEAAMVQGVGIYPASSLTQVVDYCNGKGTLRQHEATKDDNFVKAKESIDYIDVRGQEKVMLYGRKDISRISYKKLEKKIKGKYHNIMLKNIMKLSFSRSSLTIFKQKLQEEKMMVGAVDLLYFQTK